MNKDVFSMPDAKTQSILTAAAGVFGMYGFKRTSMEDIAKAADMSRAALYLHFKNKADIFRSLVTQYYAQAAVDFATSLNAQGSASEQLMAGFRAISGDSFEGLLNSPHGAELLDTKATSAGPAVEQGEAALTQVLSEWIEARAAEGLIGYAAFGGTPTDVAKTMIRAYYGLKAGPPDYATFAQERDQLIAMYGAALSR